MLQTYSLSEMTIISPLKHLNKSSLKIERNLIVEIGKTADFNLKLEDGMFLYPALINIHDHLRGDYLPKIGPKQGDYYLNWSYWEKDLRGSTVLNERSKIPVEDAYRLGAYKNLFSGVVTVNDHFPHEYNEPFIPFLPIRVISNYTLAHECSSFDLKWGDGIEIEHKRAVERNFPFITHLEEGFDEESQGGIDILESLNCLDNHDIFVHCIGFSEQDIKKTRQAGASVAWCPASNLFMFNLTCKIRKIISSGINVCIGTDSTHTGSINLLEEMRFARRIYRKMYGEDLDARLITNMVTVNPAKAFRMSEQTGRIEQGKLADILIIKPRKSDPYEALVEAEIEDIDLLVWEGTPIYGSKYYEELFKLRDVEYTQVKMCGREMLVKGDPMGLLKKVRKAVGFKKTLDYMPLGD